MNKKLTTENRERRKSGNTELRQLVNSLKVLIDARDALWSLSLVDRLFRRKKISAALDYYDNALVAMRNALVSIYNSTGGVAGTAESLPKISVTIEELDVLLGRVRGLH